MSDRTFRRVLDLGCGLDPHRSATVVMDINPVIRQLPDSIEKHVYDLNRVPWPFEDSSTDAIYCHMLFEHLQIHVFDFFRECHRVLRPNGVIHFKVPNNFFITARLRFLMGNFIDDSSYHPFHIKLLKPSYVRQHLRLLGFSLQFQRSTRLLHMLGLEPLWRDMFARGIYLHARKKP